MAGTKEGALKAVNTTKIRHGEGFYADIGRIGGQHGHTGGFAYDSRSRLEKLMRKPKLAQIAGKKGGIISRRKKSVAN